MIIDVLLRPFLTIFEGLLGGLPKGELGIPVLDALLGTLAKINSVIPIAGPIAAAVTMLTLLGIFVGIRLLLTLWRQVPFT